MINDPLRPRFVFFGTPRFAVIVLDELEQHGYIPALVVTAPDKPQGRKLLLTPSAVKVWAGQHGIPVLTPEKLRDEVFLAALQHADCDLFIVAAYGKIIPKDVLDMPARGVLNVHPSLLPKFRGPSPIESAILSNDDHTGVSIMKLDEEMDHGSIVAQKEYRTNDWPPKKNELTEMLAHEGGKLLVETIPEWMAGLKAIPQDHSRATYTKKITKEDGLIDLAGDPLTNYKKIQALDSYFFTERNGKRIRVRVIDATYRDLPAPRHAGQAGGTLIITRVIPEGKKEMSYEDFLRGAPRAKN